jgi:uncharacterized protein
MLDFHAFEKGGQKFLFFPRSARLYELSSAAFRLLAGLCATPDALEAWTTRQGSSAAGDQDELCLELRDLLLQELAIPRPNPHRRSRIKGKNGYRTFSIYLAQTCNMSCCYCWNRGGSFGKPPLLMGEDSAKLAAEHIISLARDSSSDKIFVNFYGGEPLLNFTALETITLELRRRQEELDKDFYLTVDTNGTLLEGETAQFLARHFDQVGVSLDGRQEIHDIQRPGSHGETTWRKIVDNVKAFPNRKLLSLRATLTFFSDSYLETFRQLITLGVSRIQLEYCHEPGYHDNPIYEKLIVPPGRQLAELEEFVNYYVDSIRGCNDMRDIPFVANLMDNIFRIRRGNRFTRPCGAGTNTLAINSSGEIFPCIAFVDRQDFSMGRIGQESGLRLHRTLAGFEVDDQPPCNACWLRYDCAGGCYATHCDMTGQARQPHPEYCENMRGKAEVYLYAMALMLEKCPQHLEK